MHTEMFFIACTFLLNAQNVATTSATDSTSSTKTATSLLSPRDVSVADVQNLLQQWELSKTFGDCFREAEVSGFFLSQITADTQPRAEICQQAPATAIHWNILQTFIDEWKQAPYKPSSSSSSANAKIGTASTTSTSTRSGGNKAVRRGLASSAAATGIRMVDDEAVIEMGADGDVSISRSGDRQIAVDADLTVSGSLVVNGSTCECGARQASCPVGHAASSPAGAYAEKMVSYTNWMDLDMQVSVETFSDDDRVLVLCNLNYNPEADGYWGETALFRNGQNLGTMQRYDALNEHNQAANVLFMDTPGMTGTVTYNLMGKYNGGIWSVSQGSLKRHCVAIRSDAAHAQASLPTFTNLQIDSTSYVNLGTDVTITVEDDDEAVLVALNANFDSDSDGNWGYFTIFVDDEDTGPWQVIDGLSSDNAIANILLLHQPGAGTHTYSARAKMSGSSKNFDLSEAGLRRQLSVTRVGTNWNEVTTTSKIEVDDTSYMSVGLDAEITTTFDGQQVLVTVNTNFNPDDTSDWGWMTIYRDDTDLGPLQICHHPDEDNRVFNGIVLDSPGAAGTYEYKAMFKACSSCEHFDLNQASYSQIGVVALEC